MFSFNDPGSANGPDGYSKSEVEETDELEGTDDTDDETEDDVEDEDAGE